MRLMATKAPTVAAINVIKSVFSMEVLMTQYPDASSSSTKNEYRTTAVPVNSARRTDTNNNSLWTSEIPTILA